MMKFLKTLALGGVMALSAVALDGCGPVAPPDDAVVDGGPTSDTVVPVDRPPVNACSSSRDCAPGFDCVGPEGCGVPWACVPAGDRACTRDWVPFCGCDGQTFNSSSSCPERPYARRGACVAEDAGPLACQLPGGGLCPNGQSCPAGDGCNTCICRAGQLTCTLIGCVDAGPPQDVPGACRLPSGGLCREGQSCPAGDGCNTCYCSGGSLACTRRACVDAGPSVCRFDSGRVCREGERCPADDGCNTCTCIGGQLSCTEIACPDGGPGSCQLQGGGICQNGQTCPAGDGCNTCQCRNGQLACTLIGCVDAGPPQDVPGACRLPGGVVCQNGQTCPLGDGCNSCSCRNGQLACTGIACQDAGPSVCRLPGGGICREGERCPAGDGCNTCSCVGGSLACTRIACQDAGPRGCLMPNDEVCPPYSRCALDRCTVCYCDGNGSLSCSGSSDCPAQDAGVDAGPARSCVSNNDCRGGELCDGPPGCGVRWTCVSGRACTADSAPFCGCDGRVFYGSSSCPGQPYQNRGLCGIVPPDAGNQCAAQNAAGSGNCAAFFGYAWNGRTCVGISGCGCVGSDCRTLAQSPEECRMRYSACIR